MVNRVKEVSAFDGTSWGAAVPLGANDSNIDITSSTTQPDGSAVSGVSGDSATALNTSAVTVSEGDTGASAWTKFNRFRKRVANNFANYIQGSIATSYNATGSNSAVYSTSVLNNYMSNVIGYSGTTTPSAGTVAAQLSSLNDNIGRFKSRNIADNLNNYYNEAHSGMYYVGAGITNAPPGFSYFILFVCPTSNGTESSCRQFAFSVNTLATRSRSGNPMTWSDWYIYSNNTSVLTAARKTVTMPANTTNMWVDAPSVSSYTFVVWLNIVSSGSVRMAYPAEPTASSTSIWSPTSSSTATTFICTALYRHN